MSSDNALYQEIDRLRAELAAAQEDRKEAQRLGMQAMDELVAECKARETAKPIAFLYWTKFGDKLLSFKKYDAPGGDYTECIPLFAALDAAREGK